MSNIDFTPTAYTVESPEDGAQVRYEGAHHEGSIKESKRRFLGLAKAYPGGKGRARPLRPGVLRCR